MPFEKGASLTGMKYSLWAVGYENVSENGGHPDCDEEIKVLHCSDCAVDSCLGFRCISLLHKWARKNPAGLAARRL